MASSSSSSSSSLSSGLSLRSITPSENEFYAESSKIIVKSFFEHNAFYFISGRYGPFRIDENVEVALSSIISLSSLSPPSLS